MSPDCSLPSEIGKFLFYNLLETLTPLPLTHHKIPLTPKAFDLLPGAWIFVQKSTMKFTRLILTLSLFSTLAAAQNVDWPNYGNDPGGRRFVDIDQITPDNVSKLKVAWTFRTGEYELYQNRDYLLDRAAFEATPLVVKGRMYFPTPSNRVFAVDAASGEQIWQFDPEIDLLHTELSEMTCRGVSYWTDGSKERILMGTIDGRLFSIDAQTGLPDPDFGNGGYVDLKLGVGMVQVTSAPAIYQDLVIIGSSIGDNNRTHESRGVVKAFQIRDGKEVWHFDPIPTDPNDPAFKAWENNSAYHTGAANVWATISVDRQNDLVFLPTSSPSPDFYGGERLGNNDYANSVVALKASTGAYQWHFQAVHHDIWDYDLPAQPLLFDYPQGETSIPAVAIGTKMGHIFVLNRLTGAAILPYEERPVPQSDVPGERTSPTQPFPIKPAPIGLQDLTIEDAWGPNPAELKKSQAAFSALRYEGIFTPPSFGGSLLAPGNTGGINWSGMSYDPQRNLLITNINRFAYQVKLLPRHEPKATAAYLNEVRNDENAIDPETNRMLGTPYGMARQPFIMINEAGVWSMTRPPWGTILAIDLRSGDKVWEKPLGYMADVSKQPEYKDYGSVNMGGTCLTAGGLTFIAATPDNHLRAFDTATGELLWQHPLPASGIATPMSYYLNGKQYIVITAGGHGKISLTTKGDYVLAFTLAE
jgi:quinoprotein glucose dehydrogenase